MIRIGDYYYSISAIAAPAIGSGVDYEQVVTINKHLLFSSSLSR